MIIRTPDLTMNEYGSCATSKAVWICGNWVRYRWFVKPTATICLVLSSRNSQRAWPVELRRGSMYLEWRDDEMALRGDWFYDHMFDGLELPLAKKVRLTKDWSRWYVSVEYTP